MEWLADPNAWMALLTLTALEIVLGIDNIIFIAILVQKLPKEVQKKARLIGLSLAMILRIGLLFSLTLIMSLTSPVFTILANEISGRDIILLLGGLFLLAKSTLEIHEKIEDSEHETQLGKSKKSNGKFLSIIIQILLLDLVFSIDSVVTAIGMANDIQIMIIAVVIAVIFMMIFIERISNFVEKHPTIKVLALSFLMLIGLALIGDGLDMHIPKGYIYFAMAFSIFVEVINIKIRQKRSVAIHE